MTKTLRIDYDIDWLPPSTESHLILDDELPPRDLITSAFVFAFADDRLLMTKLAQRGWDIPGGHIEPGETPAETAQREAYEETMVRLGELRLFGYQKVVLRIPRPADSTYQYPVSYQVFYWAPVKKLDPFVRNDDEAVDRKLYPPVQARATR